jgi:hypothetical protein
MLLENLACCCGFHVIDDYKAVCRTYGKFLLLMVKGDLWQTEVKPLYNLPGLFNAHATL